MHWFYPIQAAKAFDKLEEACIHFEEIGGLTKIENLQTHENEQVYHKALHIIEEFFSEEVSWSSSHGMNSLPSVAYLTVVFSVAALQGDEDENVAPAGAEGSTYQFGGPCGDAPQGGFNF